MQKDLIEVKTFQKFFLGATFFETACTHTVLKHQTTT